MNKALSLLLMVPLSAHAGFMVLEQPAAPAAPSAAPALSAAISKPAPLSLLSIEQKNYSGEAVVVRRGKGRGVTIKQTIEQVAPSDWKLNFGGVSQDILAKKVRWDGGIPWLKVLDRGFTSHGLHGIADWRTKTLMVSQRVVSGVKPSEEKFVAPLSNDKIGAVRVTEEVVSTSTRVASTASCQVKAGSTLHDTLTQWSDAQVPKWTVVWGTDLDYPIRAGFSISGSYLDCVAKLFNAYSHAAQPLYAEVHSAQRLIYISNGSKQ